MGAKRENRKDHSRQIPERTGMAIKSRLESLAWALADFPDPVVVADNQPQIIFINRAARKLFNLKLAKDIPAEIQETLPDELKNQIIEKIVTCLNGRELNRASLDLHVQGDGCLNIAITAQIIPDHEGNAIGCLAILRDLRSDLLAQPEIKSQISLLDSILKNFPTPFFIVDKNLTVTEMNQSLEMLTGYSRQEALGRMTCASLLCTSLCNTDHCLLHQAMKSGTSVSGIRQVIVDRQGREIPVVVNASVITDAENNIIGGFEFIRDISHRVETEEKLNLVTELTQEGILLVDENLRIIFANSKMADIVGIPKENLIGMTADKVIPEYYYQTMTAMMQEIDHGVEICFCSIFRQPNDEADDYYRNYETCMALSTIGKRLVTSLYFRDLSQRNQYERELRQAKSFLENVIRSSVDGIIVVDMAGNVLYFNEGAERILGYKAEEVIGHTKVFQKFYEPDQAREIMRRMRSSEYGPPGKLNTTRLIFKSKDGEEIPVNFSAAIIKEGDREIGSVGIFSDRRENMRIRKELDEAKRQLWQTEKIASLGRLAAAVAHEINNPLAGILIYADMLMRDIGENQQWREDLEEIRNQTLRCKQIVTRLLEFSRMPLGQRLSFDINGVINTCVEFLCHQAMFHDIEFEF